MKKQKQTRERPTQGGGGGVEGHSFITEMAVFTLETDYLWEIGYSFDNSRQIGNTSQFENGLVLIFNKQSAWLYLSLLTDSLKMDYPFQETPCTAAPSPQKKIGEGVSAGERGQPYTG